MSGNEHSRDWRIYNEELVVGGEVPSRFRVREQLEQRTREGEQEQEGGQYKFPESFIRWETVWKQWTDYRDLEGIARSLAKMGFLP